MTEIGEYVLLPVQCPSWLEEIYDEQCAGDGITDVLHLPAYDAMVKSLVNSEFLDLSDLLEAVDDTLEWFELRGLHELKNYKTLKKFYKNFTEIKNYEQQP